MKICTKCKIEKPLEAFGRRGKGTKSWCKQCYSNNFKAYWPAYRDANRETIVERVTRYKANHPEWEKDRKNGSRIRNIDTHRTKTRRYRARKEGITGNHTGQDILKMYKDQAGRCNNPYCRVEMLGAYSVDHVIPVSRGGSNNPDNLQLMCTPCNSSKGALTMDEWMSLLPSAKDSRNRSPRLRLLVEQSSRPTDAVALGV